jgi:glycosyltransferase involved in cell wall biosynthesis
MKSPAITWLMPVRNAMPYLTSALRSIAEQTYKNHKIIAWDNESTDRSAEELHRWIPAHIPGRVVTNAPLSLGASRAALIGQADTELCALMDADDINYADRLERQVSFMLDHPEVAAVGGQLDLIDENGAHCGRWTYKTDDAETRWLIRWHSQLAQNSVLCRRSAVLAAGNYRDVPDEDLDLWMRLAAVGEIRNLPEPLMQYRRTSSSQTGRIVDFFPTDRRAATRNASILFPNVRDPHAAMELWKATHPNRLYSESRVTHIWQLERAARLLAKAARKPRGYFMNTPAFLDQHYSLKTRAYRRFGLRPLLALVGHPAASKAA